MVVVARKMIAEARAAVVTGVAARARAAEAVEEVVTGVAARVRVVEAMEEVVTGWWRGRRWRRRGRRWWARAVEMASALPRDAHA